MNTFLKALLFSTFFLLWSCSTPQSPTVELPANSIQCTEPRPQMCTMEYVPVCASDKSGETKTYATGCNACSDLEVVYYQAEECKS